MNEMKNMRNFNEFKEESLNEKVFIEEFSHLNEEALWAAIKNLFSKMFGKVDKVLTDMVSNFTKKLDGSKTWEESVKFFNEALTAESQNMDKSLETVTGPLGLRKVLGDNASIIYIQWMEMKNKYAIDACHPKAIFQGNAMFQFDKVEDFNKNILNAASTAVIQINKGIQPPPFNEAELQEIYNKNNSDINQVQSTTSTGNTTDVKQQPEQPKISDNQQTPPVSTSGDKNNVKQNLSGGQPTESYNYQGYKLFEEADPIANSQPNPTGNPSNITPTNVNQQQTNQQQTNQQQTNQQQTNQQQTNQQQPFEILKENVKKYIQDNYYGYSSNKIKQIKAPAKIGAEDAVFALAKNSKATKIPQSLAKLLRSIINVKDKQTLMNIRDAVAKSLGKNPEDMKNDMPL